MWNEASIDDPAIDIGDPGRITSCPRLGLRTAQSSAPIVLSVTTRRQTHSLVKR
jgi:hypothetical protein